jgi:hypothetical protein
VQLLGLKNQGKKSAKTRKLGFLKNDCAWDGGDSRKPTKNQGENQGSRKPSVLVGFLRQKKDCAYPLRGCMHRRVFIKKTWLSAFSYAQSHILLVFCCSLGFLVPWFSPLQLNKIWRIFCVMYGEEGGWTSFICLQKLYLTDMFEWLLCYIQL